MCLLTHPYTLPEEGISGVKFLPIELSNNDIEGPGECLVKLYFPVDDPGFTGDLYEINAFG